ncbi:MAG: hypothetical protein AAFX02_10950, partial [Pseudomonadota bacterium]
MSTLDHTLPPERKGAFNFQHADSGILLFALGLCVGASVYLLMSFEPPLTILITVFVGVCLGLVAARRFLGSILVLPIVFMVGCSAGLVIG